MNFTKAAVWGFTTGFTAALVVAKIRMPRPGFLISADKKEHLSKKEAAAKINDVLEDREILFELLLMERKTIDLVGVIEAVQLKALTDPQWGKVLEMLRKNGFV